MRETPVSVLDAAEIHETVKKILLVVILAQSVVVFRLETKVRELTWDMQYAIEQLDSAAFYVPPTPNVPREAALESLRNPQQQ